MKYHRLVNKEKDDIIIKSNYSDILDHRFNYPYYTIELINLESNLKDYIKFLNSIRLNIPDNLKYVPNVKYPRSSIVKYNNQLFMSVSESPTNSEPHMYSKDWMALTDSWGYKCVGYCTYNDSGDVNSTYKYDTYGTFCLSNVYDILKDGKYYDYFNDGDYIIITDSTGNKYTMRMNYQEWIDVDGGMISSIDMVSDELLPYYRMNFNNPLKGIETDEYYMADKFANLPIWEFSIMSQNLERFDGYLPNHLLNYIKKKKRCYRTYARSTKVSNGGVYANDVTGDSNYEKGRLFNNTIPTGKKSWEVDGYFWLPTEKEVFGRSYGIIDGYAESNFNGLKTLDTPFKRVKTLRGVPKNWCTYSIYRETRYPCIVSADGTQIPLHLTKGTTNEFNLNEVYMPLCFTFGEYKK